MIAFGSKRFRSEIFDVVVVESFTNVTYPAGAPLNGSHDRAPVEIWPGDRERWISIGEDVNDLFCQRASAASTCDRDEAELLHLS